MRTTLAYLASIFAGCALAILSTHYAARDNVYVMFAVLLVVTAALGGGMGPAIAVAITSVIGDDLLLTGRLPPLDQWRDEVIFGTIAITVGMVVAAKRRQQQQAERLAERERNLRTERDAILAAVSHDVRNPLAVIVGSARQAGNVDVPPEAGRLFKRIESAALQASHLIDELADLRSLDGNRIELEREPCDLRHIVAAAIEQMQVLSRVHRLTCVAPAHSVMVDCDERRLQRVFQNVIGNAIKYSPDGGDIDVTVDASGAEARVVVGVPDERFGERVTAVLSARPGRDLDDRALIEFSRTRIAGYKTPRQVICVPTVQRAPNGKADYKWAKQVALDHTQQREAAQ